MNPTNPKVDAFISRARQWQPETVKLRAIALDCELGEELKWGKPCYTYQNSNLVVIQGFKEYCALLFVKGVLLKDPAGILVQPTQNMQAARQARFTSLEQIEELEPVLKAYILEAVEAQKAGLKVEYKPTSEFPVAQEFAAALDEMPELKTAFDALTPGRQRAYLLYFSGAKQSRTRAERVEKYTPHILNGKGLNDE